MTPAEYARSQGWRAGDVLADGVYATSSAIYRIVDIGQCHVWVIVGSAGSWFGIGDKIMIYKLNCYAYPFKRIGRMLRPNDSLAGAIAGSTPAPSPVTSLGSSPRSETNPAPDAGRKEE